MQSMNQADFYARRRDAHHLFAVRAQSIEAADFHVGLAGHYAYLAIEAQASELRSPAARQPAS